MKKLLSIAVAVIMIMALSIDVLAIGVPTDLVLVTGNQETWSDSAGERITIDGPGEYTLKISGVNFSGSAMTLLYIKDAAAVDASMAGETYEGSTALTGCEIITKSIKISGQEVPITEGVPTGIREETGLIDICYLNIWGTSYIEVPNVQVTDIEVVIEVIDTESSADTAAASETDEKTEAGPEPEKETTENSASSEDNASQTSDDVPATGISPAAAPSDSAVVPDTGVVIAIIPAVAALAVAAASKKR